MAEDLSKKSHETETEGWGKGIFPSLSESSPDDLEDQTYVGEGKAPKKELAPRAIRKMLAADVKEQLPQEQQLRRITHPTGLVIEDWRVGTGAVAEPGKTLQIYIVGKLTNNTVIGRVWNGEGYMFRLGSESMEHAWVIGFEGMREGGRRRIVFPPQVPFGSKVAMAKVPLKSTVVFDVELLNVH